MQTIHVAGLLLAGSLFGCGAPAPMLEPKSPSSIGPTVFVAKEPSAKDLPKKEPEKALRLEEKKPLGDGSGDAFGEGALGLAGAGEGGGGVGQGIGLGALGVVGHGAGTGLGAGAGGKSGAKGKVSAATATTTGSGLEPDVIAGVVRAHMSQIRYCYENAIAKNPTLAGKVAVKFVIDAAGAVQSASASDTNIADADMVSCVLGAVKRMAFPAPDGGGTMVITYPFQFAPAD